MPGETDRGGMAVGAGTQADVGAAAGGAGVWVGVGAGAGVIRAGIPAGVGAQAGSGFLAGAGPGARVFASASRPTFGIVAAEALVATLDADQRRYNATIQKMLADSIACGRYRCGFHSWIL